MPATPKMMQVITVRASRVVKRRQAVYCFKCTRDLERFEFDTRHPCYHLSNYPIGFLFDIFASTQ